MLSKSTEMCRFSWIRWALITMALSDESLLNHPKIVFEKKKPTLNIRPDEQSHRPMNRYITKITVTDRMEFQQQQ